MNSFRITRIFEKKPGSITILGHMINFYYKFNVINFINITIYYSRIQLVDHYNILDACLFYENKNLNFVTHLNNSRRDIQNKKYNVSCLKFLKQLKNLFLIFETAKQAVSLREENCLLNWNERVAKFVYNNHKFHCESVPFRLFVCSHILITHSSKAYVYTIKYLLFFFSCLSLRFFF